MSTIHEILTEVGKLKNKQERIDYLRENNSVGLRDVLKCAFDGSVHFRFPDGAPPYTEAQTPKRKLINETGKFANFIKNSPMRQGRAEMMFIELLETIDPNDAKILIAMKDKQLKYKAVTKKLIESAFPGLIKE